MLNLAYVLLNAVILFSYRTFVHARAESAIETFDDEHTEAWLGRALEERTSQNRLLSYRRTTAQEFTPASYVSVVVNKRYVLDEPIQGGFLESSPRQVAIWWAPWDQVSLNEHFVLDSQFSRGGCGEVWLAKDLRDLSRRFVLKRVFPAKLLSGSREVYFGEKLKGTPRVARFVEAFNRTARTGAVELWLVFEDEGTSLKNLLYEATTSGTIVPSPFWRKLRESGAKGFAVRRELARQLLFGIKTLTDHHIVHRDIKPGNVLIGSSGTQGQVSVKLGDFGSAIDAESYSKGLFGHSGPTREEHTRAYEPPEMAGLNLNESLDPAIFDASYDAWSLGTTLLEILLGTDAVFEAPEAAKRRNTRRRHTVKFDENPRIAMMIEFGLDDEERFATSVRTADPFGRGFGDDPESGPLELDFVFRLLRLRSADRLSLKQALAHPYIQISSRDNEDSHIRPSATVSNIPFRCGHCGREFSSFAACDSHARARKHRLNPSMSHPESGLCLSAESQPWSQCSSYTVLTAPADPQVWCGNSGGRSYSEDFFAANPTLDTIVVADGHWGETAARFTVDRILANLSIIDSNLRRDEKSLIALLTGVFADAHSTFLSSSLADDSGTALTAVLIRDRLVAVANVGDVRALACCDQMGIPLVLTTDHHASDDKERALVEAKGGKIEMMNGRLRVNGRLALTRVLGDRSMGNVLIHEPDIRFANLTSTHWLFIVVATDGLFDAVANDEVVGIVRAEITNSVALDTMDRIEKSTEAEQPWFTRAARRLVYEARARGLTQDNVGVAVIPL